MVPPWNKEHMGLQTWTDAPHGKIQKFDVVVAKNYLSEPEIAQLSRLVPSPSRLVAVTIRSKSLSNRRSWTMRYFSNSLSEPHAQDGYRVVPTSQHRRFATLVDGLMLDRAAGCPSRTPT